ncbi:hypothetical protein IAQ61_011603 [Plenodomus lingam]|uniref:uncharacterized protein n=1 Tax=Leptosphaeria maculans TaxID=5022 RepID=UPI0033207F0A|nr:hypothetical protein IAQ61_011603 [Plenodomus lingam]
MTLHDHCIEEWSSLPVDILGVGEETRTHNHSQPTMPHTTTSQPLDMSSLRPLLDSVTGDPFTDSKQDIPYGHNSHPTSP